MLNGSAHAKTDIYYVCVCLHIGGLAFLLLFHARAFLTRLAVLSSTFRRNVYKTMKGREWKMQRKQRKQQPIEQQKCGNNAFFPNPAERCMEVEF